MIATIKTASQVFEESFFGNPSSRRALNSARQKIFRERIFQTLSGMLFISPIH